MICLYETYELQMKCVKWLSICQCQNSEVVVFGYVFRTSGFMKSRKVILRSCFLMFITLAVGNFFIFPTANMNGRNSKKKRKTHHDFRDHRTFQFRTKLTLSPHTIPVYKKTKQVGRYIPNDKKARDKCLAAVICSSR